jgi:hypothetical protein
MDEYMGASDALRDLSFTQGLVTPYRPPPSPGTIGSGHIDHLALDEELQDLLLAFSHWLLRSAFDLRDRLPIGFGTSATSLPAYARRRIHVTCELDSLPAFAPAGIHRVRFA